MRNARQRLCQLLFLAIFATKKQRLASSARLGGHPCCLCCSSWLCTSFWGLLSSWSFCKCFWGMLSPWVFCKSFWGMLSPWLLCGSWSLAPSLGMLRASLVQGCVQACFLGSLVQARFLGSCKQGTGYQAGSLGSPPHVHVLGLLGLPHRQAPPSPQGLGARLGSAWLSKKHWLHSYRPTSQSCRQVLPRWCLQGLSCSSFDSRLESAEIWSYE